MRISFEFFRTNIALALDSMKKISRTVSGWFHFINLLFCCRLFIFSFSLSFVSSKFDQFIAFMSTTAVLLVPSERTGRHHLCTSLSDSYYVLCGCGRVGTNIVFIYFSIHNILRVVRRPMRHILFVLHLEKIARNMCKGVNV